MIYCMAGVQPDERREEEGRQGRLPAQGAAIAQPVPLTLDSSWVTRKSSQKT